MLYLAVSASMVSSVLVRQDDGRQSSVYYMSKCMTDVETRYPLVEKLALAQTVVVQRL